MLEKILFVDDEPNLLQSIKRNLRKQFDLDTAESGPEALQLMKNSGPYAVVVSDMKMPGMDGVEFLSRAKQQAPETVRMMLTGNADQETAVAAVNDGDVFRFLNKPCDPIRMAEALNLALNHYRLLMAERDLLENTLHGSIQAMAEVLSLTNPEVFGRATRYKTLMTRVATEMGLADLWHLETAALLCQIGCVTVPREIVKRKVAGKTMPIGDLQAFHQHTRTGAQLLNSIPRMENIADCILYQEKNFDGSGHPEGEPSGVDIPLGARLLKVIIDFDAYESGLGKSKARAELRVQAKRYDPVVLAAFEAVLENEALLEPQPIKLTALTDRMILAEDIFTTTKIMLVPKGQETTESVRKHLSNFFSRNLISDSVVVWQDKKANENAEVELETASCE